MNPSRSLTRRITLAVALVVLCAALAAGFYFRLELLDGDVSAAVAFEYEEVFVLLAPFAIAAPVAAYLVARWTLGPLARIEQDAEAVSPDNLNQRLNADRAPKEALGLVNAVNGALDRLGSAYERERQFTANAAHALRTPLAVLSLRLQQADDQRQFDISALREDMRRLDQVVDKLLSHAKAQRNQAAADARVNLSRVAREVAAALLPLAELRNKQIEVIADQAQIGAGSEEILGEAVRNVLENAILHGTGDVQIRIGTSNASPWIMVSDEGAGPEDDLRERSFERFVRGRASRGTGLGLSIARDVLTTIGAEISWEEASAIRIRLQPALRYDCNSRC